MPERYETAELLAMQVEAEAPSKFFTNMFFGNQVFFDKQTVEFDIVRKGRRLAPFVAPTVAGKPMKRDGFITKSFKPAYIKQKTFVDVTRPMVRTAGEPWQGNMTPMQRMDKLMAEDIALHSSMLESRLEWMAAETILKGGYIVDGEDYPRALVNFGQPSSLTVALAGAATWDQLTSSPLSDIEAMARLVRTESYGAVCGAVIMDTLAWELFRSHADIKDLLNLDIKRADQPGTSLDLGIRAEHIGAWRAGTVAGRFVIWVYEAYYEDETGESVPFMPDYTCIVAAPAAVEGQQLFGAILDIDAEWLPVKQFYKSRSSWDPTGEELLSQSAPLIAPKRIATWGTITVA